MVLEITLLLLAFALPAVLGLIYAVVGAIKSRGRKSRCNRCVKLAGAAMLLLVAAVVSLAVPSTASANHGGFFAGAAARQQGRQEARLDRQQARLDARLNAQILRQQRHHVPYGNQRIFFVPAEPVYIERAPVYYAPAPAETYYYEYRSYSR